MFARILLAIAVVFVAVNAGAPSSKSVTTSVKDVSVKGLEGLNLNWEAPFKFDDYIVGFRYHLGNLKKVPASLFAKRTVDIGDSGATTVDVDYNVDSKVLNVDAKWINKKGNFEANARGNSDDRLVEVGASTHTTVDGRRVNLKGNYNVLSKKAGAEAQVQLEDTAVSVAYDNKDKDAVIKINHKLDSVNSIEPSLSLKNKNMAIGWTRAWNGGSLETTYHQDDRVDLKWKDKGANGVWTTKAEVPLDDFESTTVTFSRDWDV